MSKDKHPTQGQVLAAMHKGALITVEYMNEPPSNARKIYRLSTNNRHVPKKLVAALLASGLIQANEDGLPGIGEAQTYRIARDLKESPT